MQSFRSPLHLKRRGLAWFGLPNVSYGFVLLYIWKESVCGYYQTIYPRAWNSSERIVRNIWVSGIMQSWQQCMLKEAPSLSFSNVEQNESVQNIWLWALRDSDSQMFCTDSLSSTFEMECVIPIPKCFVPIRSPLHLKRRGWCLFARIGTKHLDIRITQLHDSYSQMFCTDSFSPTSEKDPKCFVRFGFLYICKGEWFGYSNVSYRFVLLYVWKGKAVREPVWACW